MARRKRSIAPSTCCAESVAKDTAPGDACCEPKCPASPCDQKSPWAECTSLCEATSCPEPTDTESDAHQRFYCNAICGKKQVVAIGGSTAQTVSCTTIRHKQKKKGSYSTLHGLPQQMSACSSTCGSPLQTSPCARTCRIPLHFSPCANRRRLPPQFTLGNSPSDPCTNLCTNTCNGQCTSTSGTCCAQSSCAQPCTSCDEPLVMTAYLPITIKLCQPTCTANVPCTCVSPCKSPTCSSCCQKKCL